MMHGSLYSAPPMLPATAVPIQAVRRSCMERLSGPFDGNCDATTRLIIGEGSFAKWGRSRVGVAEMCGMGGQKRK